MHSIHVSDVASNVNIQRPLLNCSIESVKSIDSRGIYGCGALPAASRNVSRKYRKGPWEQYYNRMPLLHETFERVSANIAGRLPSPLGISNWTNDGGATGVFSSNSNNDFVGKATSGVTSTIAITNAGVRNVDVRMTCPVIAANLFLALAHADVNNRIYINCLTGETKQVLTGTTTTPIAATGTSLNGTTIRAVLNGTSLRLYRNNDLVSEGVVSASLTATNVGFIVVSDSTVQIANFVVLAL